MKNNSGCIFEKEVRSGINRVFFVSCHVRSGVSFAASEDGIGP